VGHSSSKIGSASSSQPDTMGTTSSTRSASSQQHHSSQKSEPAPPAVTAFGTVLFDKCIAFAERMLSRGLLESSELRAILDEQSAEAQQAFVSVLLRCSMPVLEGVGVGRSARARLSIMSHTKRHVVCCTGMPRAVLYLTRRG
jgi:hypothetical protein